MPGLVAGLLAGTLTFVAGPKAADDLSVSQVGRWSGEAVAAVAFVATLAAAAAPARGTLLTALVVGALGIVAAVLGPYAAYLPVVAWFVPTIYAIAAADARGLGPGAALAASVCVARLRPGTTLAVAAFLGLDVALAVVARDAVPDRLTAALLSGVVADVPLGALAVLLAGVVESALPRRDPSGEPSAEGE